jgi:hypothetical protein
MSLPDAKTDSGYIQQRTELVDLPEYIPLV